MVMVVKNGVVSSSVYLPPDLESLRRLADLADPAQLAHLTLELGLVLGRAEGALGHLLAAVDGREAAGAHVERVELVVVQRVLVLRVLVAGLGRDRERATGGVVMGLDGGKGTNGTIYINP